MPSKGFSELQVLFLAQRKKLFSACSHLRKHQLSIISFMQSQMPSASVVSDSLLGCSLVSEGSAKQSTEGGDEAEEPATRAQELAGSESDTSFVKPIRSPKIAGVQSLESMYKDHLARKELKKAFLPTEGLL